MKISKYPDTKPEEDYPGVFRRDIIAAADGAPNFCMRLFELEPGRSTPYHTHPWEHETFILSGKGVVVSEKGETPIDKDSVVFIPPDEQHCFTNKGNDALRFICVIPIVS